MGFNEIVGKIDKFLQEGAKQLEDALNSGVNSADNALNGGIDSLRESTNTMINKMGVKDYPTPEPYVSDGVDRLSGLGEAEPNISVGNIIRPSIGSMEPVKTGSNGEFLYGNVEEGLTINNGREPIIIEQDNSKVNLDKVVINSPITVETENVSEVVDNKVELKKSDAADLSKSDSVVKGINLSKE